MASARLTRGLTLGLAGLYLAAGIAEAVGVLRSGDDDLWFSWGTLVGGGVLLLAGLALTGRQPRIGRALVCVGSLLGVLATSWTSWTIVLPPLAIVVVVLTVQASAVHDTAGQG